MYLAEKFAHRVSGEQFNITCRNVDLKFNDLIQEVLQRKYKFNVNEKPLSVSWLLK